MKQFEQEQKLEYANTWEIEQNLDMELFFKSEMGKFFPVKDQIVDILSLAVQKVWCNYSSVLLQHVSTHTNEWAWQFPNKAFIYKHRQWAGFGPLDVVCQLLF